MQLQAGFSFKWEQLMILHGAVLLGGGGDQVRDLRDQLRRLPAEAVERQHLENGTTFGMDE
jgi:hypothetical protein